MTGCRNGDGDGVRVWPRPVWTPGLVGDRVNRSTRGGWDREGQRGGYVDGLVRRAGKGVVVMTLSVAWIHPARSSPTGASDSYSLDRGRVLRCWHRHRDSLGMNVGRYHR